MRTGLPYTRLGYRLNELALTVTEAQKALNTGDLLQALEGEDNQHLNEDVAEMAGNFDVMLGDVVQCFVGEVFDVDDIRGVDQATAFFPYRLVPASSSATMLASPRARA